MKLKFFIVVGEVLTSLPAIVDVIIKQVYVKRSVGFLSKMIYIN